MVMINSSKIEDFHISSQKIQLHYEDGRIEIIDYNPIVEQHYLKLIMDMNKERWHEIDFINKDIRTATKRSYPMVMFLALVGVGGIPTLKLSSKILIALASVFGVYLASRCIILKEESKNPELISKYLSIKDKLKQRQEINLVKADFQRIKSENYPLNISCANHNFCIDEALKDKSINDLQLLRQSLNDNMDLSLLYNGDTVEFARELIKQKKNNSHN
jgi:hypothetical protein